MRRILIASSLIATLLLCAFLSPGSLVTSIVTPVITATTVTVTGLLSAKSTNNNVQYADQFSGATADVKIQAAINAACPQTGPNDVPVINGIVDARGLTGNQSIAATITMRPNCTLLLGVGTYTLATGVQILFDSGDTIQGANKGLGYVLQRGTQFQQTAGDTATAIAYVSGTGGAGAYGVYLADFSMYDASHTAGSVGISFIHTTDSRIDNVVINGNFDTGLKLGFTGGCDCYNSFHQDFIAGTTYGLWIIAGPYANQNQWYGGEITSPGVALYLGGANNAFYSPDFENDGTAIEFPAGNSNTVYSPYFEANTTDVLFDSGAVGGAVIGGTYAKVTDNSGNNSNFVFTAGSSATQGGAVNGAFATKDLRVGGASNNYQGWDDLTLSANVPDGGLQLNWGAGETGVYGRTGGFPLSIGPLTSVGGANLNAVSITSLPNPPAPTITQVGAAGTTSYSYYIVCKTPTGGKTLPSPVGTITTGNATLSSTNYNVITAACGPGFNGADLLKGGTLGNVLLTGSLLGPNNIGFSDTGQALTAYTPPTRNTTGDMSVAGTLAMSSNKITSLANGSAGTDAAAFGQLLPGDVSAVDDESIITDASRRFGSFMPTHNITITSATVYDEHAAGTCTTAPAYDLKFTAAPYTGAGTLITSSSCSVTGTLIGSTACSLPATNIPSGDFVFWVATTSASSCAASFRMEYSYTTN